MVDLCHRVVGVVVVSISGADCGRDYSSSTGMGREEKKEKGQGTCCCHCCCHACAK